MLFGMPSEDLHIAAKFDLVLSRLSESRCGTTLSAQTLDFMQMLLGAYEVHALYETQIAVRLIMCL